MPIRKSSRVLLSALVLFGASASLSAIAHAEDETEILVAHLEALGARVHQNIRDKSLVVEIGTSTWTRPIDEELRVLRQQQQAKDAPEILSLLKRLRGIRVLTVQGCKWFSDVHLEAISTFENVVVLKIGGTAITDDGLKHVARMSSLMVLSLRECRISDPGLARLAPLKELRVLDLAGTSIGDDGLKRMQIEKFRELRQVDFSRTAISSDGVAMLRGNTELKSLDLSETRIDDSALTTIGTFAQMSLLILSGCEISDSGLESLGGLSKLYRLGLNETNVTNAGLVHLKSSSKLRYLYPPSGITDVDLVELRRSFPSLNLISPLRSSDP